MGYTYPIHSLIPYISPVGGQPKNEPNGSCSTSNGNEGLDRVGKPIVYGIKLLIGGSCVMLKMILERFRSIGELRERFTPCFEGNHQYCAFKCTKFGKVYYCECECHPSESDLIAIFEAARTVLIDPKDFREGADVSDEYIDKLLAIVELFLKED